MEVHVAVLLGGWLQLRLGGDRIYKSFSGVGAAGAGALRGAAAVDAPGGRKTVRSE